MGAGRPTDYTFELVHEMCTELSNGAKLQDVLKKHGIVRSTFYKWKRDYKEFSDLYINVAQDKGELCVDEIDQTIEDLRNGVIDPSTANVIIQALKWKAAKFYPKMFADRIDHDHTTKGEQITNTPILSFFKPDEDK
jgi:hypothetical protein